LRGADGSTQYDKASSGFRTKDMLMVNYFVSMSDDLYNAGHSLAQRGSQLLALQLKDYLEQTFNKWKENIALTISDKPILAYDERNVMIEIEWLNDRKVFKLTVIASKRGDAHILSRHLESLRQDSNYNLSHALEISIVQE
ncbi:MAG: hypothetical protein ACYDBJ_20585, partial [Aggregatilineales bacterium]